VVDVLLQWRTIKERPFTGLMHAFVFWGFVAFGGYTLTEFLYGLGIVDLTHAGWFHAYRLALTPFATGGAARHRLPVHQARLRPAGGARHEGVDRVAGDRAVHRDADDHLPADVPARRRAVWRSGSTGGCTRS
jgi:hypothetical protein